MPTLINLRRRIRSVRNSQQITQAMKTVSMAKYKKAQRHVLESRPYWHVFPDIVARIVALAGA
ncbi:MAG: synthase gamma chain, partial [Candidatus Aminicenantes bacterium]|nr:synthase gamma chain [Candidatus Aminicenantes bacterium]